MGYPLREQVAGGVYHVATRRSGPAELFRDASDRRRFLLVLRHVVLKYRWRLHAYCVLGTHYHLIATTPEPNISRGMQLLNSLYVRTFNERHRRLGHLVAARFAAALIESEEHALEVCRYLPLNPVRAGLCARPETWPWSSYAATLGLAIEPPFLDSWWILERFGDDLVTARQNLREHVDAALPAEPSSVSETLQGGRGLAPGSDPAALLAVP